ncbi:MAG: hypothetical protein JWL90_48 [Chthoniobacteraceae bacterium]|nr:hypothetical protein [Chthoniobacteraceae bacterium]
MDSLNRSREGPHCSLVKTIFAIALGMFLAIGAAADDWQKTLSPSAPGSFPLPRPSHGTYAFGWSALSAAEGTFDFSKPKAGLIKLDVVIKTTGTVRKLYRLDANHSAITRSKTLQPLSVRQAEVYKGETIKTKLDFDSLGVVRARESSIASPGNGKAKRFKFSPMFDMHGLFLWLRSQRLQPGDIYRLVVYPSTDPFLAEMRVVAKENLKLANRTYPALKIELKLRRINKKLEIESYENLKSAAAWISNDSERVFLKAEAEISIGKVWVELEKIEKPTP